MNLPSFPVSVTTCASWGCEHMAIWQPILEFRRRGYEGCTHTILRMGVCDKCRQETVVDDLLSDETFDSISRGIESLGYTTPDRELTTLDWRLIIAEA